MGRNTEGPESTTEGVHSVDEHHAHDSLCNPAFPSRGGMGWSPFEEAPSPRQVLHGVASLLLWQLRAPERDPGFPCGHRSDEGLDAHWQPELDGGGFEEHGQQ